LPAASTLVSGRRFPKNDACHNMTEGARFKSIAFYHETLSLHKGSFTRNMCSLLFRGLFVSNISVIFEQIVSSSPYIDLHLIYLTIIFFFLSLSLSLSLFLNCPSLADHNTLNRRQTFVQNIVQKMMIPDISDCARKRGVEIRPLFRLPPTHPDSLSLSLSLSLFLSLSLSLLIRSPPLPPHSNSVFSLCKT
jgi:hypothetical protein